MLGEQSIRDSETEKDPSHGLRAEEPSITLQQGNLETGGGRTCTIPQGDTLGVVHVFTQIGKATSHCTIYLGVGSTSTHRFAYSRKFRPLKAERYFDGETWGINSSLWFVIVCHEYMYRNFCHPRIKLTSKSDNELLDTGHPEANVVRLRASR